MLRGVLLALALLAVLVAISCAYLAATRFLPYQATVDSILTAARATDEVPPDSIRRVFPALQGRLSFAYHVSTSLYRDVGIDIEHDMGEWNIHGAVWEVLLPLRLSRDDLTRLYLHYVQFGTDGGLRGASRKYFGVTPKDLTRRQALGLVAVGRSPT